MYNQLYSYFDNILFPNQFGFRKGNSAQQCLLVMIEKFKKAIDRGHEFGALLIKRTRIWCPSDKLVKSI